jgi:hypothetical protein
VLKALAAIYRASLRWLEGYGRLFSALRADRLRFHALNASRTCFITLGPICLAGLATLRLVLETLVREKHLFTGGEDELGSTIGALQDFVMVFHALLRGRVRSGQAAGQSAASG